MQPATVPYLEVVEPDGGRAGRIEVGRSIRLTAASDTRIVGRSSSSRVDARVIDRSRGDTMRMLTLDQPARYPSENYGPCWRLAVARDSLFRLSCSAGRIQALDMEGRHGRWIELADDPRASTEDELEAYVARLWEMSSAGRERDELIERQLAAARRIVEIRRKYAALRVDPVTDRFFVLEQPFGDYTDRDGVLHIVTPEGQHARRIETGRRIRDLAVHADTIAMLVRDPATDLISLELYLLEDGASTRNP